MQAAFWLSVQRSVAAQTAPAAAAAPSSAASSVLVLVLLDATASMAPWISAARRTIQSQAAAMFKDFRVAYVCYRDCERGGAWPAPEVRGFGEPAAVQLELARVGTIGNSDWAEDVAGGAWVGSGVGARGTAQQCQTPP